MKACIHGEYRMTGLVEDKSTLINVNDAKRIE